ncbi:MAG: hypothetical protein ACT4QC_01060 [Planctomycetaceae bacterium]
MRFAIIGEAPPAPELARAIAASASHELAAVIGAPALVRTLGLSETAHAARTSEDLLGTLAIDAVVLAGADDTDVAAARRLVEGGCALLVVPGDSNAATLAYELSLVEAGRPAPHFPLFALRGHPLVERLLAGLADERLGSIQHVLLHRHVAADAGLMAAEDIFRALAQDGDLLRVLFGEFNQVTANRALDPTGKISMCTITLAGPNAPQTVWSATAPTGDVPWTLTVVGANGTLQLAGDADAGRLQLTDPAGAALSAEFDPGAWLLQAFEGRAQGENARAETSTSAPAVASATWHDLIRNADLLEAVERSMRRRRTIDLYFDLPSERGTFKTQMTAVGCGLLVVTLGLVVAYLTTAALLDLPTAVQRTLVVLIFLPLGIFLALQGFYFLTRPADPAESAGTPPADD